MIRLCWWHPSLFILFFLHFHVLLMLLNIKPMLFFPIPNLALCLYWRLSQFHPSHQHHYYRPWCHHHYYEDSGHDQAVSSLNGSKPFINICMPFLVPYFMQPMLFFICLLLLLWPHWETRWFACRSYFFLPFCSIFSLHRTGKYCDYLEPWSLCIEASYLKVADHWPQLIIIIWIS